MSVEVLARLIATNLVALLIFILMYTKLKTLCFQYVRVFIDVIVMVEDDAVLSGHF